MWLIDLNGIVQSFITVYFHICMQACFITNEENILFELYLRRMPSFHLIHYQMNFLSKQLSMFWQIGNVARTLIEIELRIIYIVKWECVANLLNNN